MHFAFRRSARSIRGFLEGPGVFRVSGGIEGHGGQRQTPASHDFESFPPPSPLPIPSPSALAKRAPRSQEVRTTVARPAFHPMLLVVEPWPPRKRSRRSNRVSGWRAYMAVRRQRAARGEVACRVSLVALVPYAERPWFTPRRAPSACLRPGNAARSGAASGGQVAMVQGSGFRHRTSKEVRERCSGTEARWSTTWSPEDQPTSHPAFVASSVRHSVGATPRVQPFGVQLAP